MNYLAYFKDENDIRKAISNSVIKIRENNNLTQQKLAEMLEGSVEHISRIENEKYTCSINLIFKLCSIFKMEIDEFFGVEKSNNSDLANFLKDLSLDQRDAIVKFCKEVEKSSSN